LALCKREYDIFRFRKLSLIFNPLTRPYTGVVKTLRISEVKTREEFYEMRNRWDRVLCKSADNNIFLSWEKMAPSVNHLEQNSSLKILCASEDNNLIAIAPFRITHKGLKGHLGYGVIEPLTNGNTDYTGLIISDAQEQCLDQFINYLFSQKDWDFLYLPDFPQTSLSLNLIEKVATDIPFFEAEKGIICPYISVPNSKEKLLTGMDKKFEKKLNKSLTKLEREKGKVELKEYSEIGTLEQGMQTLFELHQRRWEAKGNKGNFAEEKSRHITLQTAKYFAEKNWLKLYFLTVDSKPVAVELNLEYEGKMYCHLKGLDPNYYKYRVGSILTLKVLELCISKGITEYDFMQGDEPYKFDWTDKYRQNTNIKGVNRKTSSKVMKAGLSVLRQSKLDIMIINYLSIVKKLKDNLIAYSKYS
jgi:hypothetical protein